MTTTAVNMKELGAAARKASRRLAATGTAARNAALEAIAAGLAEREGEILAANGSDLAAARAQGLGEHIVDRLMLNHSRIAAMAQACRDIAALADPVGEMLEERTLPNGLQLQRVRVPLGVIGVIYESRPNVTIDITALCLKSGNAVILRGGKEAFNTNSALAAVARDAVRGAGLPEGCIQFVASTDRALVREMLGMDEFIDLLIPRGSAELVRFVGDNAAMPAVTGGIGVCHTYVDSAADLDKALRIVVNAKVQRPTVCNALDTVLVHSAVAEKFLPRLAKEFGAAGVEMRAESRAMGVLRQAQDGTEKAAQDKQARDGGQKSAASGGKVVPAKADDFGTEFLALIASVKVVDSLDDAMEHIARYGSGHSEAIVTEDSEAAERFLAEVDAAAVFSNTSTRFNDGGEFGLGAEVAISTSKLHARGPMGLREITTYKWVVRGDGQVRG
jgi:glutamate-5-semialdehyde dehydrogenase